METTATIQSDISSKAERAEPFTAVLIFFSLVGLAVSLLAARYGLEVAPSLF